MPENPTVASTNPKTVPAINAFMINAFLCVFMCILYKICAQLSTTLITKITIYQQLTMCPCLDQFGKLRRDLLLIRYSTYIVPEINDILNDDV